MKKTAPALYVLIAIVAIAAAWRFWPSSGPSDDASSGALPAMPLSPAKVVENATATSAPTVSAGTMNKAIQSLSAPPAATTTGTSQEDILKTLQAR